MQRQPAVDQILGVVQPDVGAMGQTGNPQQFGERARTGQFQNAADKLRAEFRQADRPGRFAIHPRIGFQRVDGIEDRHRFRIVHRNRRRIDPGDILQQTHRRRIDVAEDIEFQDVVMDIMEIEVRRFPFGIRVIGRILNRRKVIDVHGARDDDDAAGMLAGCPFDTLTSVG